MLRQAGPKARTEANLLAYEAKKKTVKRFLSSSPSPTSFFFYFQAHSAQILLFKGFSRTLEKTTRSSTNPEILRRFALTKDQSFTNFTEGMIFIQDLLFNLTTCRTSLPKLIFAMGWPSTFNTFPL